MRFLLDESHQKGSGYITSCQSCLLIQHYSCLCSDCTGFHTSKPRVGGREGGGREGGREGERNREGRGRENEGWSEEGALYLIPGSIPSPLQISSFNL